MPPTGIKGSDSKGLGRPPNKTPTWRRVRGKFAILEEICKRSGELKKVQSFEKVRRTFGLQPASEAPIWEDSERDVANNDHLHGLKGLECTCHEDRVDESYKFLVEFAVMRTPRLL